MPAAQRGSSSRQQSSDAGAALCAGRCPSKQLLVAACTLTVFQLQQQAATVKVNVKGGPPSADVLPAACRMLYGSQARFFDDEISPKRRHGLKGCVGMASAGRDLNASQVRAA